MTVSSKELMNMVVTAADDKKASNIVALDLNNISLVADYFVICHGNSDTQVQAIATEIRKQAHAAGATIKGIEGMDSARWVLMDLGDVVVHVFHRDEREYYNIERLWSDAKVVETV
ncbi:ribosome silencing factor [Paenibacillus polysaccharolyticus]|uniref:Ribosomal silencing factor RsfS n=2 Tax=Paenibacillus TaxID=44249 RepID=A0A1G5AVM9_9BACL|nr:MULTISPECIES: ribosome silencing factor [Paenibacillus]MDP9699324.1 ribosome-associated protein [Paenibacillus intestini]MBY0204257.1 ribosome silencing factor [Paenibacillus cucumis (ex Kampfer et al. 2016)]MCP1132585.1 ribosome silencing factor [Paenibacillus polysaccharolyticus]MDT0124114.1 ribosome silencing factor [Paenibacillus sp. RRE4]SCX81959.1 ribosome-associated protein [Paenibacillus polysaccharolyticus]